MASQATERDNIRCHGIGNGYLTTSIEAIKRKNIQGQQIDGISLLSSYKDVKNGHDYLFWRRGIARAVRHKVETDCG
jgi:enterochelin esterase-like enzyme